MVKREKRRRQLADFGFSAQEITQIEQEAARYGHSVVDYVRAAVRNHRMDNLGYSWRLTSLYDMGLWRLAPRMLEAIRTFMRSDMSTDDLLAAKHSFRTFSSEMEYLEHVERM